MQQLQDVLGRIPRSAYILGIPAAIVLVVGYAILFGGGSDDNGGVSNGGANQQILSDAAPTSTRAAATSTPRPAATAVNRADCNAIRGTDYRSPEEQAWFKANCSGGGSSSGSSGGGGSTAFQAGPARAGVQLPTGSRLVIPGSSVDTEIYGQFVSANAGVLPDPSCYFCAVEYDLSAYGLSNHKVLAAHVDCATCHNGSSGAAAFWDVTHGGVRPGMEVQYYTGSGIKTFVVTAVGSFSPSDNIVGMAASADMMLITCGGTWDPVAHEYSNRTFVFANLKA